MEDKIKLWFKEKYDLKEIELKEITDKLKEYRQSLIASIEGELPKRNTSNDGAGMGFEESVEGYNSCLEEVKSILNKYK